MTKRLLSMVLALMVVIGMIPFVSLNANAADDGYYNVSEAIKYADKNWNNGVGLCAEFVSRCLQAGGVDVFEPLVINLYNALNGTYGTAYKLKLTGGTSGTIKMADNEGKLSQGDPIFFKCNYCGDFEHVVLCNGGNSEGYSQDYAHNNPHNGRKTTYTYRHCGGDSWTLYSIKMETGPKLYGAKNSVGIPEIKSLSHGADGIVIKWNEIKEADKYRVYRKDVNGSYKYIGTSKTEKYTDKTAKDNVEYVYAVRAVDGKVYGQFYEGKQIKCVGAPKLISVDNNGSSIEFDWGKIKSADGYIVYRKSGNGSWKKLAKVKGANKHAYIDEKIEEGVKYTYTVKAYDGSLKGAYSSSGKKIVYLKAPELLSAESITDGISLSFSETLGASGYKIYRKADGASKWSLLAKVSGGDITEFIDMDVEDGISYKYTVKAFSGSSVSLYDKKGILTEFNLPEIEVEAPEAEETIPVENQN